MDKSLLISNLFAKLFEAEADFGFSRACPLAAPFYSAPAGERSLRLGRQESPLLNQLSRTVLVRMCTVASSHHLPRKADDISVSVWWAGSLLGDRTHSLRLSPFSGVKLPSPLKSQRGKRQESNLQIILLIRTRGGKKRRSPDKRRNHHNQACTPL